MNIETPKRPFWLKAMIGLVTLSMILSALGNSAVKESIEGGIIVTIQQAILLLLFMGLIFNSIFIRWLSVAFYSVAIFGTIMALIKTYQLNQNLAQTFFFSIIPTVVAVITICFALSRNVRSYYIEIGEISRKVKESKS